MYNLSSAQGVRFAEVCSEMIETIRALGPNPLGALPGPPGATVSSAHPENAVTASSGSWSAGLEPPERGKGTP